MTDREYQNITNTTLFAYIQPFLFLFATVLSFAKVSNNIGVLAVVFVALTIVSIVIYVPKLKFLTANRCISKVYFTIEQGLFWMLSVVNICWLVLWQVLTLTPYVMIICLAIRGRLGIISIVEFVLLLYSTQRIAFVHTLLKVSTYKDANIACEDIIRDLITSADSKRISVGYTGMSLAILSFVISWLVLTCGINNMLYYILVAPMNLIVVVLGVVVAITAYNRREYLTIKWWLIIIAVLCNILSLLLAHLLCRSQLILSTEQFRFEGFISTPAALLTIYTTANCLFQDKPKLAQASKRYCAKC